MSRTRLELSPPPEGAGSGQGCSEEDTRKLLDEWIGRTSAVRPAALAAGAKSYSDPEWAAASIRESWLFEQKFGNSGQKWRAYNRIANAQMV